MGIVKHGVGEVLREDDGTKTASAWTAEDDDGLVEENDAADAAEKEE